MLDQIEIGSNVTVKIVKQPTNQAAIKTLRRVLATDATAAKNQQRLEDIRKDQYDPRRRGGRLYGGQMRKIHPIEANLGEQGTIKATASVINDLKSVGSFIEVTPRK